MKNERFFSIKTDCSAEITIEKSKFITSVKRVNGEDEAKAFVSFVRAKYKDATHNCYAYIADNGGFFAKFSDDGEPQGTAGLPMLEVLKQKGLRRVAAVVTRYFGGIKLGTGGLSRAYSESVKNCLEKSGISEFIYSCFLKAEVSFQVYPRISAYLSGEKTSFINSVFNDNGATITFAVPVEDFEKIKAKVADLSAGKSQIFTIKQEYSEYET